MGNIDKGIKTIEKQIASVDNIGCLKIDKTVTIGMGMGHMCRKDDVTVKMEFDILGKSDNR